MAVYAHGDEGMQLVDIIVIDDDPTKNINTMTNVVFVIKNGKIYNNQAKNNFRYVKDYGFFLLKS